MKDIAKRSIELALKLADHGGASLDDIESAFREHEADVRADERAKVLARVRMAVQICRLTIDDEQVKAILKGIEDGCDP